MTGLHFQKLLFDGSKGRLVSDRRIVPGALFLFERAVVRAEIARAETRENREVRADEKRTARGDGASEPEGTEPQEMVGADGTGEGGAGQSAPGR
jgi:hypothetical protein